MEEYRIGNISSLDLNFYGDSLKIVPSEDGNISILASENTAPLKALKFENVNGTLTLTDEGGSSGGGSIFINQTGGSSSITISTGGTFVSQYMGGGYSAPVEGFLSQFPNLLRESSSYSVDDRSEIVVDISNMMRGSSITNGEVKLNELSL